MTEAAQTVWTRKDLVGIEDLSRAEIELILDTAPQFLAVSARESGSPRSPAMAGQSASRQMVRASVSGS